MKDAPAYDPATIEKKWQQRWDERRANVTNLDGAKPYYALMMFPYPSAEGLHVAAHQEFLAYVPAHYEHAASICRG